MVNKENIRIDNPKDVEVDVSQDRTRLIRDRSQPFYLQGTSITFRVPFQGDLELFRMRPNTFSLIGIRGQISKNEILMTFSKVDPKPEEIKHAFEVQLNGLCDMVNCISGAVKTYNSGLKNSISQKIKSRKDKINKDSGIAMSLGYPIKSRDISSGTYEVPVIRKKIIIEMPKADSNPFKPEPVLEMKNYEEILKLLMNMSLVMERSPESFKTLGEEAIRTHFLIQLNSQFEGSATGETFNHQGKTDILIRVDGRNIFIAECLIWRGEKYLSEKIDQILSYATWRDTKVAILIFNKGKDLSKVIEQISQVVNRHKNFKRKIDYKNESGFRFVLHNNDDKNREITMTVIVFDVPK